jgi:hypothetical protein
LLGSDDVGWNLSKVKGFNTKATIKNLIEDLAGPKSLNMPGSFTGQTNDYQVKQFGEKPRNLNYKVNLDREARGVGYDLGGIADQSSSSRTADISTTGLEPEGYSPLNRTSTLPGETTKQAAKRNAVLAQISGWNPKESTWFKNSDVAAYESKQKTLRTLVTSGQVNPMDIAWDTMKSDFNTGSFNPDDLGRYIKPSAATDTTTSALKQVVGKSTSKVKPTTGGVPQVKRAADVAPSTVSYEGPDINIAGLTDSQIQRIPAYQDALDALADVDMDAAAKTRYATQRTRDALKQLDLQDANAKKGFQRMLKAILKGL